MLPFGRQRPIVAFRFKNGVAASDDPRVVEVGFFLAAPEDVEIDCVSVTVF